MTAYYVLCDPASGQPYGMLRAPGGLNAGEWQQLWQLAQLRWEELTQSPEPALADERAAADEGILTLACYLYAGLGVEEVAFSWGEV